MTKTYKVKATKRAWIEITADKTLSQKEVYELASNEIENKDVEWEEPSFNIVDININDTEDISGKSKVEFLKALDPLTNKKK